MVKIYNRKTKEYEIEKVAGDKYLNWVYSSPVGKSLTELFIKKKLFSSVYGRSCDTRRSRRRIGKFIKDFDIDMSICETPAEDFSSFNDFFTRKLKAESRPFDKSKDALISPGDGRLLAFTGIDMDNLVQVKGYSYSLRELLGDDKVAESYQGGCCLVLRLAPTDYHRFHFIDNGTCSISRKIKGSYYSVNPVALNTIPKVFCQNKREWSLFKTDNLGEVIYVEVGATCVGTIVQSYSLDVRVTKGEEKGYFKFGGSTVILFFKRNTVKIHEDILEQSAKGFESKVLFGETIGEGIGNI